MTMPEHHHRALDEAERRESVILAEVSDCSWPHRLNPATVTHVADPKEDDVCGA